MDESNVILSVLKTIGGVSAIFGALAAFLAKVWADRIAKQTIAKFDLELLATKANFEKQLTSTKAMFDQDLAILKAKSESQLESTKAANTMILTKFQREADANIKDREQFAGISLDVYKDFFKRRISTYTRLLEISNSYMSNMNENISVEIAEAWGDVYFDHYKKFRKVIDEEQLYISTDLEKHFHNLKVQSFQYFQKAEMSAFYAEQSGESPHIANENRSSHYLQFATDTSDLMQKIIEQIRSDVSKLRARIDLDRVV